MEIRPGEAHDLEALNDVYNHYVRTSPATFDIDETTLDYRRKWFGELGGPHKLYVAIAEDSFLGFAYSAQLSPRRAYDTSVTRPPQSVRLVHRHPTRRSSSRRTTA